MDFFEMERVIDELARSFAAPSATTWFKVSGQKRPTLDEYRMKVVEFMNMFESILVSGYRSNPDSSELLNFVKTAIRDNISMVLLGRNKEVEKRYKYYVDYS